MRTIFQDKKFRTARIWSNRELRRFAHLFQGDVLNVSAWKDSDKEGSHYQNYFFNARSYTLSNYKTEARGFQGVENEFFLDLEKELVPELAGKYDTVFNHTTLEHIYDFRKAFHNICRLSKDIVILVVPFLQEMHADYGDFWRFTPMAIRRLFAEEGLETIYLSANDHARSSIYLFVIASRKPNRWSARFPKGLPVGAYIGKRAIINSPLVVAGDILRSIRIKTKRRLRWLAEKIRRRFARYRYHLRDVVVISYPKSGRTWLRVMLDSLGCFLDYSHDGTAFSSNDILKPFNGLPRDKSRYAGKRIVLLVRDPRDTVVSGYFHATKRDPVFSGSLAQFIRDDRLGLRKIIRYHSIWNDSRDIPNHFLLIRYEDLRADTYNTIMQLLKFIGISKHSKKVNGAIMDASFEKMRNKERQGLFHEKYGNRFGSSNPSDTNSLKVRRGKVGGYVDYFSPSDEAYYQQCLTEEPDPFY